MARRIDTQAVISAIRLFIGGKPTAPAAGYDLLYAKTGGLYVENESGAETGPLMGNPMTAAGDVIVGGTGGTPGKLTIGGNGTVLTSNGTTAGWATAAVTVVNDYICIQDQKSTTNNGGTFTQGAWRTRDLNTEVSDVGNHATLNANQITLAAGTYTVQITAPAVKVNGHQALLYNVTGAAVLLYGTSAYAPDAHDTCTESTISGKIVLAAPTVLEVQHQCFTTCAAYGFGADPGFATTNIYTSAEFWKVA